MAALQFNAALSFLLVGIALLALGRGSTKDSWLVFRLPIGAVAILSAATLIEYFFHTGVDLDQLHQSALEALTGSPIRGRMSRETALCFALLVGSFLFLGSRRFHWLAEAFAIGPALIALLFLTGVAFNYTTQAANWRRLPLPAVTLFLFITIAFVGFYRDRGLAALTTSPLSGGVMARRLLPAGLLVPFFLGLMWLIGNATGVLTGPLGLALYVLFSMLAFSALILWYASILNRLDHDRLRDEAELRSSREMLQLVLDTVPLGIFWKDRHSRYLGCNRVVATAVGINDPKKAIGMTDAELGSTTPEQCEFFQRKDREVMESDTPQNHIIEQMTLANGATIWMDTCKSPMHDSDGQVIGVLGSWEDITERKRAELNLQDSERRFRSAFDHTDVAMVLTDLSNRFVRVNEAFSRLFGYSIEELQGMTVADITHPDDLAESYSRREGLMAGAGTHFQMEKRYVARDGRVIWGLTNVSLLRDGYGQPMNYVGQVQDITHRKRAEEALRAAHDELELRVQRRTEELAAANKELEAFSYSVSHDLRAPLRAIDGFSRIVLEEYGSQLPADAQEFLYDIRTNARQMGRLVDDLLAFSHLGRKPLNRQTVDVSDLVDQCVQELESAVAGRAVEFRVGELLPCQGDPALLKQAWINLLSNAVKYSGKKDRAVIEVGSEMTSAGPQYFVRDNGVGFDMKYAHKLFGVFQRLHRAEDYEGTGVGLAIVQRVIFKHGGRVWAESQPGQGATFFFTLSAGDRP